MYMANNIEMRNRLKTIVPPDIIQAGKTGQPIQQKPQQPPPDVMIKMQALQLQQQKQQFDMQSKMQEMKFKEQELILQSQQSGHDNSVAIQKLETERLEAAAKLKDQQLRFQAEMAKISGDLQTAHADNLVKILTHQPKVNNQGQRV